MSHSEHGTGSTITNDQQQVTRTKSEAPATDDGGLASAGSNSALVLCLFQSFAGVIFGWGNSSGGVLFAMDAYKNRFGSCHDGICALSTTRQSAVTGLLSLGATIGAVSSGYISNKLGLRVTCILFIALHMIGSAIETSAINFKQVYCARVLLGLGIGATSGLVPVFQAEASPPKWRGLVTGSFQMCVTLGIWGVSMCGWGMSHHRGNISWELTCGLAMVWDLLLLVGFFLSPEAPSFLAKKGKWEQCRKSMARLRGVKQDDPRLDVEMNKVKAKADEELKLGSVSYKECFEVKNRNLWRLMVGVCVQIGQQITGINFFFSYGPQFAMVAGMANAYIFQIILASVNVGMSFPGMYAVDHSGRRPVLLVGAFIMFVGQIVTGSVSKAYPHAKGAGKVLIAFCTFFVGAFASSWGPVAWVVCGETFPLRISARCVTIGTGANWLFNLIIAFAAPQIQQRIGTGICFVWAGCLALDFLFAFFCVPETKGMSIEDIDAMYHSNIPAWKSSQFRKQAIRDNRTDSEKPQAHTQEQAAEQLN